MPRLIIEGGHPLRGETEALGAKNAVLPIMAAAILCSGDVLLERVPDISDVRVMAGILTELGVEVEFLGGGRLRLNADRLANTRAPYELVRRMNASFDVAGPLLARFGECEVALPGGCNLGQRRVNLHLDAFRALGAEVHREHGMVKAQATRLRGTSIYFPKVSVGATKNATMAASLAEGETVLENAACEPEIVDLARFLQACGARVEGAGTPRIRVEGVRELRGASHAVTSDRIVTGTILCMTALSGGEVTVRNSPPEHLEAVLGELRKAGQEVRVQGNDVTLSARRPVRSLEVTTAPFPGFPTDLHPPLVALLVLGDGVSMLHETIFDGRFMYVGELVRLGANIRVSDHTAVINGVRFLAGAPVEASDIRAGGALIAAALAAEGETSIGGLEFIDRGYENVHTRLASLGARIRRVE
ncbi:MAG: UDP-N-acetylglucosamine 1-carboxyvinyltransferase [Armatimonadetes bacterium]|nr:UDP-N-acetylglucosamine 1-carboxyvinyltransferase [Armatimonadota bacterium]